MNRCIYCNDSISIWADDIRKDSCNDMYIMDNKTHVVIGNFFADNNGRISYGFEVDTPQDIQAAFNLYDKDGNVEHIMPKED